MKSRDKVSSSGPTPFRSSDRSRISPVTEEDRAIACEHDIEIHELCRDTTRAMQELRYGIAYVLLDTLEQMDLDVLTLVQLLDECPSVVRSLMDGEADDLTTETMIEYLETLRRVGHPVCDQGAAIDSYTAT